MPHYTMEALADYVRGLVDDAVRQSMLAHLQRCAACAGDLTILGQVAETMDWDRRVQPRVQLLRRAYALAAHLPQPKPGTLKSLLAGLVFDSRLQPATAGLRSAGRGVRQMVFDAERYQVHVQWEHAAPGGPVSLIGRVAATADVVLPPGIVVRAVTASAVAGETTTNQFGEFVLECPWDAGLALHLPVVSDGVRIEVPLASASEPTTRSRRRGRSEQ